MKNVILIVMLKKPVSDYNDSVDPERYLEYKKARVVEEKGYWFDVGSLSCRCSVCGCKNNKESNFCPECGAYMKGEKEY